MYGVFLHTYHFAHLNAFAAKAAKEAILEGRQRSRRRTAYSVAQKHEGGLIRAHRHVTK
jgi:hypothetical protein